MRRREADHRQREPRGAAPVVVRDSSEGLAVILAADTQLRIRTRTGPGSRLQAVASASGLRDAVHPQREEP